HSLDFTRMEDFAVPHAVLMFKGPFENVGDDLHVPMAVHSETLAGLDAVFVDHPQRAEMVMLRVMVIGKRKRVVRIEPAMIEMAPIGRFANRDHVNFLLRPNESTRVTSLRLWAMHFFSEWRKEPLPLLPG